MKIDLDLGHTRLIIREADRAGVLRNQLAYILATAFWETNRTMRPVVEAYWLSEAWRKANLRYYPWHGRGFVQLTWQGNYVRAGQELDVDLITDPDEALNPEIAARILVCGSMEGWFTGKCVPDYITLRKSDYIGARRVINGTDKAAEIAAIAKDYDAALLASGYGVTAPLDHVAPPAPETPPKRSLWVALASLLAGFFGKDKA